MFVLTIMAKIAGNQLSLIAELAVEDRAVGDWEWDDVGTEIFLVPTSSPPLKIGTENFSVPTSPPLKIGTENFSVPTSPPREIGTEISSVPIFTVDFQLAEKWQPPVGCFEQKWSKDRKYWYWRYYDNLGKKRSLYLAKDYNKAIRKAIKIGVPIDAKTPKIARDQTDPQAAHPAPPNIIDIAATAHSAPRSTRAA